MQITIKVGIIGDFNPGNVTHCATNDAIVHAAAHARINAHVEWIPTLQIAEQGTDLLRPFASLWCSPGSPYNSMEGALTAIRFARETNIPFFGT